MKNPYLRILFLPALIIIFLAAGCKKSSTTANNSTLATVSTTSLIVNSTATTAQSGGVITDGGGANVTGYGVCYSTTNQVPTTGDTKSAAVVTGDGTSVINFTDNLTSLTPGATYYLRAYAINSVGTAYGSVITFTTSATSNGITSTVTTLAGNGTAGTANGQGMGAMFSNPQGITTDGKGNLYVSDSFNSTIRFISSSATVTTFAGIAGLNGYNDGAAASAQFYSPAGLVADVQGNLYVSDLGNNVIRKITPAGVVSTYAGNGTPGYVDGVATTAAEFKGPRGLAIDAAGNIYVADRGNNLIRKITTAGVVSTVAGTLTAGYINATGTLASFNSPNGLAVDASGNIYVADLGNSSIRKITAAGVVTTVAGNPSQAVLINLPSGVVLDAAGNLDIVDEGGRVLQYTINNTLYILAGSLNVAGFTNGTGAAAQFSNPQAITVDAAGNIYIADQGNNCIRKIVVVNNH